MVKYVTLRMVIAIAKHFGWPLDQLDVVTAFLYGVMKEQVFCVIPEGVDVDDNFDCLELVKAIYGLKQASRANGMRPLTSLSARLVFAYQSSTHVSTS